MRLFVVVGAALASTVTLWGGGAARAQFTAGNLVVSRLGDGTQTLSANGNSVFLDQYNTLSSAQAAPSFTVALPSSGANAISSSGLATSEGQLNRSADGRYLTYIGYNTTPITGLGTSTSATVPRTVALVNAAGAVDVSTKLTDAYSGSSPRSAITTNGTDIFTAGNGSPATSGGVRYTTVGGTTSTQLASTPTNIRTVNIFNGQLYFGTGSGTVGIYSIGAGTPTTSGQTTSLVAATGTGSSPYGFFFADADTLYVTDDRNTIAGGIQKYINSGSGFALQYTIQLPNTPGTANIGARAITGFASNGTVNIYAITADATANRLVSLTDQQNLTGQGGTSTLTPLTVNTLATAPTNEIFRGLAFAPSSGAATPEPGSVAFVAGGLLGGAGLLRRRKRSQ